VTDAIATATHWRVDLIVGTENAAQAAASKLHHTSS